LLKNFINLFSDNKTSIFCNENEMVHYMDTLCRLRISAPMSLFVVQF
jgi:hypothetical protein